MLPCWPVRSAVEAFVYVSPPCPLAFTRLPNREVVSHIGCVIIGVLCLLTTASLKTPSKGPCPGDPVLGQLWDGSGRKVIFVIPSCTHTHMQENCSMESAVTNVFEGKDIPRLFNVKSAGFRNGTLLCPPELPQSISEGHSTVSTNNTCGRRCRNNTYRAGISES